VCIETHMFGQWAAMNCSRVFILEDIQHNPEVISLPSSIRIFIVQLATSSVDWRQFQSDVLRLSTKV